MNLLIFTSIYPSPDFELKNSTNVVHSFAKEWVKMGHKVTVVYLYPSFPRIVHFLLNRFQVYVASHSGKCISSIYLKDTLHYCLEGVDVLRVPAFRVLPGWKYRDHNIRNIELIINQYLDSNGITPSVVIGHFHYPSIEFVLHYGKKFGSLTSVVVHGQANNLKKYYQKNYELLISEINIWGFRSQSIKDNFESVFGIQKKSFICTSGIPDYFFKEKLNENDKFQGISSYLFVGSLIKRKAPLAVLKALHNLKFAEGFKLTYVGDGSELTQIRRYVNKFRLNEKVFLLLRNSRKEISQIMRNHDIFVMISRNESFGLVYIEAMASGCITVASKKEGMDGIIIDGENGFLCESNSVEDLKAVLIHINNLSLSEKRRISRLAIETSKQFSDQLAAERYLKNLIF